jgi:hypothetical protein
MECNVVDQHAKYVHTRHVSYIESSSWDKHEIGLGEGI